MTTAEMHTRLSESVATTLLVMNALATVPDTLSNNAARALIVTDLAKSMRGLTDVAKALATHLRADL